MSEQMSNEVSQLALFNYDGIDIDTTNYLKQNAHETRGLLKRTSEDIIQIGKNLIKAKDRLPHGQFIPWAKAELGISQQTASRFMRIAKGKPVKSLTVSDLVVLPPVERVEGDDGLVKLRSPKDVVKWLPCSSGLPGAPKEQVARDVFVWLLNDRSEHHSSTL